MRRFDDADALADWVLEKLGGQVRVGLPLGLGKATHITNSLYARAAADSALSLEILTALSLERPAASSELEARFLEPFAERHFAGYVELEYAKAMRENALPGNVRVTEFFVNSGAWLTNKTVQHEYVGVNYSNAPRDVILARPINLLAQLIAVDESGPTPRYSLSCNPDVTLDILPKLAEARACGAFLFVGQVNRDLPFMPGDAEVPAALFDAILDTETVEFPIFAVPRRPIATADYVAGLHAASLVKDGGTLQIGIGSLGDAVTYALLLRQRHNALFRELIAALTDEPRETAPFAQGIYAATEMFVEGFLHLYDAGILKRRSARGPVLHAAFFAGSRDFYERLKALPEPTRADFGMTAVSFTNALYGDEAEKRADRRDARFLNIAMAADLFGAVLSDTLDDGRVVSGVGGQHDFVAQGLALDGAQSVLMVKAVRTKDGVAQSNIAWQLGRVTIPRHLRDVVVSEYGVARLRGASDADCIRRMAAIADARFVPELLGAAAAAGKIDLAEAVDVARNTPEHLESVLAQARREGFFPAFPFGSDFTPAEQTALAALGHLKSCGTSVRALAETLRAGLGKAPSIAQQEALDRMGIGADIKDRLYRRLMIGAWAMLA